MSFLGNIIWVLFGGFFVAMEYFISGFLMCITIIGIPFGFQLFKIGVLALLPFGQSIESSGSGITSGCLYTIMNIIWIFTGGLLIALTHLLFGIIFSITIIGIPFGMQHFKLMMLAFTPFGKRVS